MENYVEHKEANRQINKIKELVVLGYSDEKIAEQFELDGEKNLAKKGSAWSSRDIEAIRISFNFCQRKEPFSPVLIAIFLVVAILGGLFGLFVAFVCNGGAGGSSQMSPSAWSCFLPYMVIYVLVLGGIIAIGRR